MQRTISYSVWRGFSLFLLLVFFGQAADGIDKLSFTYDEPIYIGVGYSDWSTRDLFWHGHIGHPPLVNLLTAWPLLLAPDRPDPRSISQWGSSDVLGFSRTLLQQLGNPDRTAMLTRLPVAWIAILLAALVYRWACELWKSRAAGILALFIFVFDPTILAHGRLNSTDMGLAAFGFLMAYTLSRYLRTPHWKWRLGVGLAIGLPFSSKASGPYYLGIAGALLLVWAWIAWRGKQNWFLHVVVTGLLWLTLALLVLWAAYLFEFQPLQSGGLPIPAASHWKGLPYINDYMQSGQVTYFGGKLHDESHPWSYFFVAFLVKTPTPSLILLLLALLAIGQQVIFRKVDPSLPDLLVLVCVPVGYFAVAVFSALQIGQRHLLPVYPFLFVLCGGLVARRVWGQLSRRATLFGISIVSALMLWLAVGTVLIHPYELSYFNELVGGTDQGHHILADSSVDWGQALKAAKIYITTHQIGRPYLAAFSSVDPALYGMDFEPLPPTLDAPVVLPHQFNPSPGTYLISAVPLHGLWLLDPDTYSWFRQREPDATIGHAIFVYNVVAPDTEQMWVAQCALPLPPLSLEQIAAGFGLVDGRTATFDCTQSWLYPANSAGWYVLSGNAVPTSWAEKRLRAAGLAYVQQDHWSHPAVRVYSQPVWDQELSFESVSAAIIAGPLYFLGYELDEIQYKQGSSVELSTFWKVRESAGRPLSLMAHLISPDGAGIAVGDGLGFPIEQWQPGDVIVQRHVLAIPPDAPPGTYTVITGAYWLDTMERWPTDDGASHIVVGEIDVEQ